MPALQKKMSSRANKPISVFTSVNRLNMFSWAKLFLDLSSLTLHAWFDNGSINDKGLAML